MSERVTLYIVNLHSSSRACPILHYRTEGITYPLSEDSCLSTSNQLSFPAYSQLNPWFRWFPDASFKPLQFGLVAEEAAAAEEKITIPSELCSVVKPKKGLQSPWIVCFGQTDLMF